MKTFVQKLIGMAVLCLTLCSQSFPAWAGYATQSEVTITTNAAYGSMAGARYSTDSQQYIGCNFTHPALGLLINCSARDKTGQSFTCWSNETRFVNAAKALTNYSYIYFNTAPGSSSCGDLQVYNSSFYLK
jgi:hypothetical protein